MTTVENSPVRNGVNTEALFATINAVDANRELAKFQFRATNHWVSGTHSKSTVSTFYGANEEREHVTTGVYDVDHPAVLVGADNGPTPVEYLLVGLAGCLTAGIGNIAAARKVTLHEVESTVEGDLDIQGLLGLSDEVRNGYQQIRVNFRISADASPEQVREIVEQSRARSAVFDIITNSVPVTIDVATS